MMVTVTVLTVLSTWCPMVMVLLYTVCPWLMWPGTWLTPIMVIAGLRSASIITITLCLSLTRVHWWYAHVVSVLYLWNVFYILKKCCCDCCQSRSSSWCWQYCRNLLLFIPRVSRAHLMWQLLICCRPGGVAVGGSLTLVAHSLLVTVGVSEAGPDWAHHWQTHN